jgi:hypothetical protein
MPFMDVSRRIGHANSSHTLDLYRHAMPGKDDEIAGQFADIYNLPAKKKRYRQIAKRIVHFYPVRKGFPRMN